ncbi:DUF1801 domain-containing protein [Flavobacterium sp.]|uniref:DUF1801 domain-containing protein n=1 Tax=Flavobacterium sp. TaxID=239 RepID=UPI00286D7E7E|nr:DUF1801 domain-containing protein [Flavobacterium sp.]
MKPAQEYIFNQPKHYQEIIYYVCSVMEQEFPEAEMLFKWNIPFYYLGKKPFCYINASHKKKFVDIAFFYGNQIKNHQEFLTSENRTQIKSLRYFELDTIPDKVLREVIHEAKEVYK